MKRVLSDVVVGGRVGAAVAAGRKIDMVETADSWNEESQSRSQDRAGSRHHHHHCRRRLLHPNALHLGEVGRSCPFVGRCFSRTCCERIEMVLQLVIARCGKQCRRSWSVAQWNGGNFCQEKAPLGKAEYQVAVRLL